MSDLATLAQVAAYMPQGSSADTNVLGLLISAASAAIENYVGYQFAASQRSVTRRGNGTSIFPIFGAPVISVTSVSINGVAQSPTTYTFDDSNVYLNSGALPLGPYNVNVVYQGGYSAIPFDITQACIEIVAFRYASRDKAGSGIASETLAGQTISFTQKAMPDSVTGVLDQYKLVFGA